MTRPLSVITLISCLLLLAHVQRPAQAEPTAPATAESTSLAADSLLLDQYPGAILAHGLRKLRSGYSGPAIRVRRTSDGAEQDIGFAADGTLDTSALTSFVGSSADGIVVNWYSQLDGGDDLQDTSDPAPKIVKNGSVVTGTNGNPMVDFQKGQRLWTDLQNGFQTDNSAFLFATETSGGLSWEPNRVLARFDYNDLGVRQADGAHMKLSSDFGSLGNDGGEIVPLGETFIGAFSNASSERSIYVNNARKAHITSGSNNSETKTIAQIGNSATGQEGFPGKVGEFLVYPHLTKSEYQDRYDNLNQHWQVAPTDYHRDALLPQETGYHVDLYNYLETVTESDVQLPLGETFEYSSSLTNDEKADLWLKLKGAGAQKPTLGEPGWYVLDNGNGKGIEATGEVRLMYEPQGGPGNPPRSWENEPAFLYQMDIPGPSGSQGNPYYQMPELGRRSMVTAIVDMMMFDAAKDDGSAGWFDMIGKAFLGMAESYRWAGDVLPSATQEAFEKGMEGILDHQIARGPRGANTNMDMFMLQGAAEFYMATSDATRKDKCVQLVKRALFGYVDGALETNHDVFKFQDEDTGGVFSSAGFIAEGGQAEVFYGGESKLHLMGAYMAVYDRSTDTVPAEWQFLEEVLRRAQEWRTYQWFHNPDPDYFARGSGSGFGARTSAPVPAGQAAHPWKRAAWADVFDVGKAELRNGYNKSRQIPKMWEIENEISNQISNLNGTFSSYDTEQADSWSGWSPWTKPNTYLPPEGWYSRLDSLLENDDPLTYPPSYRTGVTFNKTFGGPPLGESWWSHKSTDGGGTEFGFFAEAMPQQGPYGGWYGGKIETFWTDEVGYVLSNRHAKSGNPGWDAIDYWGAHHTWGRDENGDAFTTAWLRGWDLNRTVSWDNPDDPSVLTVNNPFNDGSARKDGEQGDVLQGSVDIKHKIETVADGATVTHTLTSDQSDQVTELWASIPFFIGHAGAAADIQDATLYYWDGSAWTSLPEDTDSDGMPEIVTTDALRLTRPVGSDTNHAYVSFAQSQDVRLSEQLFHDTYQSDSEIRTVHVDLHGNPGTSKTLPASKSVMYTIQTTDPSLEGEASQMIPLQKGWNIVSTSVSPSTPAMDSVFAGLQSEITVVENEVGERYQPSENINEIGPWSSEEAYAVYAKSDITLSVEGDSLEPPSIALEQGWNWVPYFPSSPLSVEEAVSSISGELGLVKDESGRVYFPEGNLDVLEQMEPGEGYKVYVLQSTTLTYPDGSN